MLRTLDGNQREQLDKLVQDQATLMSHYLDTRGAIAKALNPNNGTNLKIDWTEMRSALRASLLKPGSEYFKQNEWGTL